MLRMGVWSVGGMPLVTVIRKTVMLSMVEMPRVIFSPDSAGIRKTNLARGGRQGYSQGEDVDEHGRLEVVEEEELGPPPDQEVISAGRGRGGEER